jgi:hypothetical protein
MLRLLLAIASACAATATAAADGLKFMFDADPGSWQLWFNATRDACNSQDTPDQSMTAFRKPDGTVVAFIGDDDRKGGAHGPLLGGFYRSSGPSVRHVLDEASHCLSHWLQAHLIKCCPAQVLNLTRDCSAPALTSGAMPWSPGTFPHNVWLMATWTADGKTVHGLVHDEYTPNKTDTKLCPRGFIKNRTDHSTCWYTTVLDVVSTDSGRHFDFVRTVDNPRAIALAPPVGYNPDFTRPQGFPSSHSVQGPDGYIYALLSCGEGAHIPDAAFPNGGQCVYRTTDMSNVGGWRGWDGKGYSASVVDPYANPAPPTAGHLPAVVAHTMAMGVRARDAQTSTRVLVLKCAVIACSKTNTRLMAHFSAAHRAITSLLGSYILRHSHPRGG